MNNIKHQDRFVASRVFYRKQPRVTTGNAHNSGSCCNQPLTAEHAVQHACTEERTHQQLQAQGPPPPPHLLKKSLWSFPSVLVSPTLR